MPNQPKTRARGVRVPDELWEALIARAKRERITATDVILAALRAYLTPKPERQTGAGKR